jgi:peptide/nickel transport system ATP-binding protein
MTETKTTSNGYPLLEARQIKKYFPIRTSLLARLLAGQREQIVKAVDGVNLRIWPGETVGLVGESGCGKTTLGRVITRLYEPTEGQLFYNNQPVIGDMVTLSADQVKRDETVSDQMVFDESSVIRSPDGQWAEEEVQHLSFFELTQIIFQNPYSSLNPRKTVRDIIGVALGQRGLKAAKDREAETHRLLNRVGLSKRHIDAYPHQFSGGQRQRIGIARALAMQPRFIVADEPVSSLDVSIQAQVINLLEELQEEYQLTYLIIAHDLSLIYYISDRVAVMYLGHIVESGSTSDLYQNPLHPYTQALLAAIPQVRKETRRERIILPGTVPSPIDPPSGCPFHPRCFAKVGRICETQYPPYFKIGDQKVACWIHEEHPIVDNETKEN